MAQVPGKVAAWLHSVLHEYRDPQRTYSDVIRTLSSFPTLAPRTEVYNYENGSSALLLTLSNTIPVNYRGTVYRFPIQLWVPQSYPQEPPMVYVVAGRDMAIRPGQHVGVDGRVYHPYLADWRTMWDRASIAEFLEYLQQAFSKEPPVISRAQQQQYQRPIGLSPTQRQSSAGAMPPQLPPKPGAALGSDGRGPGGGSSSDAPPPRPPKPGESHPPRTSSRNTGDGGPPLPQLPHERPSVEVYATQPNHGYHERPLSSTQQPPRPDYHQLQPAGPPLPPLPGQPSYQQQRPAYDRSPVSPVSPVNGYSELPETRYQRPTPMPQPPVQVQYRHQAPQPGVPAYGQQQMYARPAPQYQYQPPQQPSHQRPPPAKKQPPPDLLSDPFDIALPSAASTSQAPAPPIPPNPEREHLLHAISSTLVQQAQQKVSQNLSAIAPLQMQQQALRAAQDRLEAEIRQLDQLDQTLAANEAILRRSIQDCDSTIATAKSKPPPPIDDVLIAPTMVSNQLWNLCADEAACREAMYALQKAVDRGRVNGHDFVRQMRSLGRECFLKMVLARKCATGMGLEVQ